MGRKSQIILGNGVEVSGTRKYFFDAQLFEAEGIHCISHAHSDHLPKRSSTGEAVCSETTLRCINECTKHSLSQRIEPEIELFNAGHMAGSSMFRVDLDGEKILYTGDFSTKDRFGVTGARPQKTDILITESTFGKPEYVFPPQDEMGAIIHDWAEDNLAQGRSVALYSYPFGKSQDLLRILADLDPLLDESVSRATAAACPELTFRKYSPEEAPKEPFVLICRPYSKKKWAEAPWRRTEMQTAAVSGWAMNPSYKYMAGVNEAFPLSDHAGFDELLAFAEACKPSLVLTHHGFSTELAKELRSRLGIEARPLVKGQCSIFDF
ncbi:hypothetical protein [Candidatus Methanomassiliicoccus intestinalis]|uniref:hypothetical protein n=1 Tax=Candidatus Methanomassiliicoccus intestinalis TaxID=1406512 RepID=UPI0037DD7DE6